MGVFFSPLIIGLALRALIGAASLVMILAALAAFMLRQPVTIAVKAISGRRPAGDLALARLWIGVYGLVLLAAVIGLVLLDAGYVVWLAAPALPVLGWHLWLVSRRAERRQLWVEIAGAGGCADAPAAYWVEGAATSRSAGCCGPCAGCKRRFDRVRLFTPGAA